LRKNRVKISENKPKIGSDSLKDISFVSNASSNRHVLKSFSTDVIASPQNKQTLNLSADNEFFDQNKFKISTSTLKSKSSNEELRKESTPIRSNTDDISPVKYLLIPDSKNGRLITFEDAIKANIYTPERGELKDFITNKAISLSDALKLNKIKSNDPNILLDESNVYIIESVNFNGRKIELKDALFRSLIDKQNCVYVSPKESESWPIKEAMKRGLIEGKILTCVEIQWMLDDYANRLKSKSKTQRKLEDSSYYDAKNSFNSLQVQYSEGGDSSMFNKDKLDEFFVFDESSNGYVSLNDAFYNGIVLNDPVKIKDPTSGNYILLKDAVIKGLVSCEKSSDKVSFRNRSSFFTLNRISYIIDFVWDTNKRVKSSLQDAVKKGLLLNGIYKHSNRSYRIDDAIIAGYIVGRRVELENMERVFEEKLRNPPLKPTRGIFLDQSKSSRFNSDPESDLEPVRPKPRKINESKSERDIRHREQAWVIILK
jgi:hypothetical protein